LVVDRKIILSFLILLLSAFAISVQASRPEYCRNALEKSFGSNTIFDNSTFIPFSKILKYEKDPEQLYEWTYGKGVQYVESGIRHMYDSAYSAADIVKNDLKITDDQIFKPSQSRSIFESFENVIIAMRSKNPPKYIENAVILNEHGVYLIAPMLMRDDATGLYTSMVIKGHQDLKESDILAATMINHALAPYQDGIAETAYVHLRPRVKKRLQTPESDGVFEINVNTFRHRLNALTSKFYQDYLDGNISLVDKLDISKMPYAPSKPHRKRLAEVGINNLEDLAKININTVKFKKLCQQTGIPPYRFRYFVARAKATIDDRIYLLEEFEDPFKGSEYLVHVDFEDFHNKEMKSGVYLFGAEIQKADKIGRGVPKKDKKFIFADNLDQPSVEKAWAEFLRYLKNEPRLQDDNYKITVYSKHELVKLAQELDIVKLRPDKYEHTDEFQRLADAGFYKEITVYEPTPGILSEAPQMRTYGYLIRNTEFFDKYPDLKPEDAFKFLEKSVDLLAYYRHHFPSPGISNGLKSNLPYVQTRRKKQVYKYAEGDNGLNSIGWIKRAFAEDNADLFERVRAYNEIDIDANRVMADYLRIVSKQKVPSFLRVRPELLEELKDLQKIVKAQNFSRNLARKASLVQEVFGTKLSNMSDEALSRLASILDRTKYLEKRAKVIDDKRLNVRKRDAILEEMQHDEKSKRISELSTFIKRKSRNSDESLKEDPDLIQKLDKMLSSSMSYLTPMHINQILAWEQLLDNVSMKKFIKDYSLSRRIDGDGFTLPDFGPGGINSAYISKKDGIYPKSEMRTLRFVETDNGREYSVSTGELEEQERIVTLNLSNIWRAYYLQTVSR